MSSGGVGRLRALLDRHGVRPSRLRGQCFLVDANLADAIVRDGGLVAGESVVEIGCGPGILTSRLLAPGRKILAVEIDPGLAAACREVVGADPSVELWIGDALDGKHRLAPAIDERLPGLVPWVLVSNLPYAIAGPILVLCATSGAPPSRMVVTVQEEVARRIVAVPGDSEYGPLSAALAIGWKGRILRRIPPEVFWPRPRVQSALVRLDPLESRPVPTDYLLEVASIRRLFRWPRKGLRAVLGEAGVRDPDGLIARVGTDPSERVGRLAIPVLRRLARALPPNEVADD